MAQNRSKLIGKNTPATLGERLRQYYLSGNKSHREIAELIGGGITQERVRRATLGWNISPPDAYKIERFLKGVEIAA